MSRLVTASLVSSVNWFKTCPPSWKEKAYTDLKNSLSRKPWDPSIAIKKGIAFENDVYNILEGRTESFDWATASEHFKFFLNKCKGGRFQNKNKEFVDLTIGGEEAEYCLYVKEDVIFPKFKDEQPGHIIDIKTSKKWGGKSKYLNTIQHKMYCMVEDIPTFEYIVAIWEDADSESRRIASTHTVYYTSPGKEELRSQVIAEVTSVINYLQADEELWDLYLTKFCLY